MSPLHFGLALALATGSALAQGKEEPKPGSEEPRQTDDPNKLEAELSRLKSELQRITIDEERLLELRVRHGLGLTTDGAAPFLLQDGGRTLVSGASDRALRDEEAELSRLNRLLDEVQKKAAADKAKSPLPLDVEAPKSGEKDGVRKAPQARQADTVSRPPTTGRQDPEATSRPAETRRPRVDAGPKLLVAGSTDRRTVGRVLFHAGRYKEAREELLEAVQLDPPELEDHFLLAQCHERLGEPAKADDLYKRIEALDTKDTAQGKIAGPWAESARAASRQMNWMIDHGQWKLPRTIESLDWRKGRR